MKVASIDPGEHELIGLSLMAGGQVKATGLAFTAG
jgi:hypothetical protein